MKNIFKLLVIFVFSISCIPEFEPPTHNDRLHIKEFMLKRGNEDSLKIDWFYYSLISNTTLDYIESNKNGYLDTLCVSSNIADLYIVRDTIVFEFFGRTSCYEKILSKKKQFGYHIKIDTTLVRSDILKK